MKKILFLINVLFFSTNTGFCAVSVPESMKNAMKTQSDMPSLLNLVISMILVIGLIYLTGWVYQKLNRVNQAKLKDKFAGKNTFKIVSSLPLGSQKNLYAVEFNDKILVVGATQNNITILKDYDKDGASSHVQELSKTAFDLQQEEKDDELAQLYKKYKN